MISLYAWMPPARGVSGSMVIPSLVTGRGRTRGSPVSGAPASWSSVTPCALASGSSSSRVGLRSPDSSRDRVLTEIPVAADRLARVVSRRRRSARSRGPTAPSVASKSLSIRTILPNRQSSLLSGSWARIVTVAMSSKESYVRKEDRHSRSDYLRSRRDRPVSRPVVDPGLHRRGAADGGARHHDHADRPAVRAARPGLLSHGQAVGDHRLHHHLRRAAAARRTAE